MVNVAVLASHSSGNCFFVKANGSKFLVDAGITCKQIIKRLIQIGHQAEEIDGIFLTHAHSDHIKGVDVFSRKFNTPIYTTKGTFEGFRNKLKSEENIHLIEPDKHININNIDILPFSKFHDCREPVSYSISYNGKMASVITDIGLTCNNVKHAVENSNILCLESNYDIDMLHTGPYPYFLKQRIAGEGGHISNYDAALLVMKHAPSKLKTIFLSHLSETNNTPKKAIQTMSIIKERQDLKDVKLIMTSKNKPTKLY